MMQKSDYFFRDNGYMLVENLLTKDECNILVKKAIEIDSGNNEVMLMQPHRHKGGQIFIDTIKKKKIVDEIKKKIGSKINLLQTQFFFMPPGTKGFAPHQDDFYVRSSRKSSFTSLWIPLVNVKKQNGCLILWEKSHQSGIFEVIEKKNNLQNNLDRNGSVLFSQVPKKYKKKNIEINKGTGLFIDSRIVHASNDNTSTNNYRYSILYTFIRKGVSFNPGKFAKREPLDFTL